MSGKRVAFIGKSLLWSVLLYVAVMLIANWDEVNNALHGRKDIVVTNLLPDNSNRDAQRNISSSLRIFSAAVSVIRVVAGLNDRAHH